MTDRPPKLERLTGTGFLNIRGEASNPEFVRIVQEACGVSLPVAANTLAGEEQRLYWLGPDEWLLAGGIDAVAGIANKLSQGLQHLHAAVNDLSGGQVGFRLGGAAARQVLAKGCTLDLHPDVFGLGQCAQTSLAKSAVLLRPLGAGEGYEIIVRRSFASYLWQWLLRAGRQYRIEVA